MKCNVAQKYDCAYPLLADQSSHLLKTMQVYISLIIAAYLMIQDFINLSTLLVSLLSHTRNGRQIHFCPIFSERSIL